MKERPFKLFSILGIVTLGILVYSNSFLCSFHFDDDAYIVNNFAIRNIQNLIDIWNICPCRFITFLSIALNYHFHHLNVIGYHIFNLAVHLGCALLVWWLILLTFSTPAMKEEKIYHHADIIALLAALIFVSHPIQTEAVTYIWQRAASMAAFFYLASLCCYIKSRVSASAPYYFLSLIIAVVAMFTKENAITLPLMIVLYEFFFLKPKKGMDWTQLYPFWLVLFIIPQTMVLTKTTRLQEIQSIVGGPAGISPLDYLLTQFRVMMTYIRLIFLPIHLNLDYDYPVFKTFFTIPVMASFLSLATILYLAKRLFTKYRLISFSIFWFFLTLLPESSLIPQEDVIFEHRLYLPLAGYCLFLVSGVYYLATRHSERSEESKGVFKLAVAVLSIIIVFYSVLTYQRNIIWKNEITLWGDVVQKSPHKARPYINRGWAYYNEGNFTQAIPDFNKAISISPEFIYPYDDRGLIYVQERKFTEAISEYDRSISINPYYSKVYYHRALAYLKQHNNAQALSDLNHAIGLDPEYIDAYNERGKLYLSQGNSAQAIADHNKSMNIDPDQADLSADL